MPDWDRYGIGGERPYAHSRTWDPFNRNKLKGDYPIIGNRTFLNLTAVSDTFFDGRRLPTPSGESTARPGEPGFFGKGRQFFVDQVFLFSFDLFHGDTSFRPVDWRIRITPAVSVNYLNVQELGIVNVNVASGTTRLDAHAGLQEAFAEVKLADLGTHYDFISVRAGIQQFNSDSRGFIFNASQPGVRVFGNLDSNRWQYNLAYFNFLEKNTNSGINSFALRNQQVIVANAYRQDFLLPGYTAQFSVHYNMDQASIHYDDNGFLVRPAPIGDVRPHSVHAAYLGWAGDGHIGWLNLTHAFYQAFGNDSFNPLANRPVTIDARMAALELSVDKDWARFKTSVFYASGDGNPSSGRAHGFDSIDDFPEFAGGIFSLWNREGIRLTGTGVLLTPPNSLLPDLRSSKDEGQANFVNPGILLVNMGTNLDLTPKLRGFINANYLQFMRTEPLELLLFQGDIRHSIGFDYSAGVRYRPPLTENVTLTAGASALTPGAGFRDIYSEQGFVFRFHGFALSVLNCQDVCGRNTNGEHQLDESLGQIEQRTRAPREMAVLSRSSGVDGDRRGACRRIRPQSAASAIATAFIAATGEPRPGGPIRIRSGAEEFRLPHVPRHHGRAHHARHRHRASGVRGLPRRRLGRSNRARHCDLFAGIRAGKKSRAPEIEQP